MAYVFISHKSENRPFAEEVSRRLQEAGFETWLDTEKLGTGDDWREEIDEALYDSFAMVLILSPDALGSKYMVYEMAFAWALDVKVLPIAISGVKYKEFHPRLDGRQVTDFGSLQPWDKLIHDIEVAQKTGGYQGSLVPRSAPAPVKAAAEALSNIDNATKLEAIQALIENEHPAARQVLINHLSDSQPATRYQVAFALAKVEVKEAIGPIIQALYGNDPKWHLKASYALADLGPVGTDALHDALKHEDPEIRFHAARTLGQAGFLARKSIPYLAASLTDEEPEVRREVALSLGQYGQLAPVDRLTEALADTNANVRAAVAEALGRSRNPEAIHPLANILKSASKTKRYTNEITAAVSALRRIGTPEALKAVEPYRDISWYWVDLGDGSR